MPKSDTSPGLLSKMVKFVRHPTTNWSELDGGASEQEEALSKQLLKEMIERKRKNDAVRKREFDMLRKLRKREAISGAAHDSAERPSFFQSSLPSKPDDRAQTIKKIDEIEAQMSMQWWRAKSGSAASNQSTHVPLMSRSQLSAPDPIHPLTPPAATSPPDQLATVPDSLTQALAAVRRTSEQIGAVNPAAPLAGAALFAQTGNQDLSPSAKSSAFTSSQFNAVDFSEGGVHDPELEEVAIRFANSDDASAEAGLLEILGLQVGVTGDRAHHLDTWLALFDLYRATGQQDKFEAAALQFVQRFDRSAPQWFSLLNSATTGALPGKTPVKSAADWVCPATFGAQSLVALKAVMAKAPAPWHLDWRALKSIDTAALEPLRAIFSVWASQNLGLRFSGAAQLSRLLENATPAGDAQVDKLWWSLRLEFLRITQQSDAFEMVALDFCVTYELSPPSWERAHCDYGVFQVPGEGDPKVLMPVYKDSLPSTLNGQEGDTEIDGAHSQNYAVLAELSGQIQGDATDILNKLDMKFAGTDNLVISCASLVRIDFSAAGALLNWVSARQAEGRMVQFVDAHRLVMAFFNVVGITEHAAVLSRVD